MVGDINFNLFDGHFSGVAKLVLEVALQNIEWDVYEQDCLIRVRCVRKAEVAKRINFPHGLLHFVVALGIVGRKKQVINDAFIPITQFEIPNKRRSLFQLAVIKVFERINTVLRSHGDVKRPLSTERLTYVGADFFVRMSQPSINGIHHKANENLASIIGEQTLYQRVGNARESKWIDQGKRGSNATAFPIERVKDLGQLRRKFAAPDVDFEAVGALQPFDLGRKVVSTVFALLDKEKDEFSFERCVVVLRTFESHKRRTRFASRIATRSRESVKINDAITKGHHYRKPSVKVLAENPVLCSSVGLDGPKSVRG